MTAFAVVARTGELVHYRCQECGEEFGRGPDDPAPTRCPREARHLRPKASRADLVRLRKQAEARTERAG